MTHTSLGIEKDTASKAIEKKKLSNDPRINHYKTYPLQPSFIELSEKPTTLR